MPHNGLYPIVNCMLVACLNGSFKLFNLPVLFCRLLTTDSGNLTANETTWQDVSLLLLDSPTSTLPPDRLLGANDSNQADCRVTCSEPRGSRRRAEHRPSSRAEASGPGVHELTKARSPSGGVTGASEFRSRLVSIEHLSKLTLVSFDILNYVCARQLCCVRSLARGKGQHEEGLLVDETEKVQHESSRLFTEEPANVEEVKEVKDGAVESDVKVGGDGNGLGCSGDKRRICNIFKVCRKELKDTQKAFAEYRLRADYRLHAASVDV
nr:uncharacterized protein LOC109187401 [Ipomoea trifida]